VKRFFDLIQGKVDEYRKAKSMIILSVPQSKQHSTSFWDSLIQGFLKLIRDTRFRTGFSTFSQTDYSYYQQYHFKKNYGQYNLIKVDSLYFIQ
jgi:uncharacterized protein YgiB involved in biofilm formation